MGKGAAVYARFIERHFPEVVRAGEWWEYKLAPIFAAFYATAFTLHVPVSALWLAALTVLLALVPGAAYVSVINDLTDREEDRAAGKPNRLEGRSRLYAATLVAITVGAGLAFCFLWRRDSLLLSLYLGAWLAFSLYSLPPFRWKTRGILGVLCDASGAHLFPTLVAVVLAFRGAGRSVSVPWMIAVGVWALANGIRGILWHQLTDLDNDRQAGVRTFALRHSPMFVARLAAFVAFPLEVCALAAMLVQMRSTWPVAALIAYVMFVLLRVRYFGMHPIIVKPAPRFLIVLHEYSDLWLPLSILIASALRFPYDWIVIAVHLIVFPTRARQTLRDVVKLASRR
jgi:4-hydroxybenzoate polyprenyltransferase